MTAGRLVLVGGPPASGKSTLAAELADRLRAVRLTPDDWLGDLGVELDDSAARDRVERLQRSLAAELVARGLVVVLDWGVFTRDTRDALRADARSVGAAVELHFLQAPAEVLWERIEQRRRAGEDSQPSRAELDRMLDELEVPDAAERACFDLPA